MTLSLPPPALMTSAPPPPSMVSPPLPPVIVLADDEPVIVTAEESADASTFWKLVTVAESPMVTSVLPRLTVDGRAQHQRIVAGAAVDRDFRAAIGRRYRCRRRP